MKRYQLARTSSHEAETPGSQLGGFQWAPDLTLHSLPLVASSDPIHESLVEWGRLLRWHGHVEVQLVALGHAVEGELRY